MVYLKKKPLDSINEIRFHYQNITVPPLVHILYVAEESVNLVDKKNKNTCHRIQVGTL